MTFFRSRKNILKMSDPDSNPINFLQEFCQKHAIDFPKFKEIDSSGTSQCQTFHFTCSFKGFESTGSGSLKKIAKKNAGTEMVKLLKEGGFLNNTPVNEGLNRTMQNSKNPISALMEYCTKEKIGSPVFNELASEFKGFIVSCDLKDKRTYGHGNSKKSAKYECSERMCRALNIPLTNDPISAAAKMYKLKAMYAAIYDENPTFAEGQNFILKLEECVSMNNFKKPIYKEMIVMYNLFDITCNVGLVSGRGVNLKRMEAKNEAAREVLSELNKRRPQIENGYVFITAKF